MHFLPGYLSRVDGHASGDGELLTTEIALEELDFSTFIVEQGKDPECSEVIKSLRNDELPSDEAKARVVLAKSETMAIVTPGVLCKFEERRNQKVKLEDR